MDFEKQAPDEIVEDADVALEGEIPDDAAEAVAGGITAKEIWHAAPGMSQHEMHDASVPEFHTGVRAGTHRNR
jgi:hypothetical protein